MNIYKSLFGALLGAITLLGAAATPSSAFVLGPTSPGKWGNPLLGTGANVTWSLMGAGVNLAPVEAGFTASLSGFLPTGFETEIVRAFDAWAAVADLSFVEVADVGEDFNAAQASGDIRIGGHGFDGPGGVLAHGFFAPANGNSAAGDVHFDSAENWTIGFAGPGFDIFTVAAHEIGHAIGLDHTAVANSLMNPFYTEAFSGLQADDIAGAQAIYGAAITVVPLPAALPLFGSALAMMGFVGWRKRRTAAILRSPI